jgi:ribosomal protein L34E
MQFKEKTQISISYKNKIKKTVGNQTVWEYKKKEAKRKRASMI